jgi:hypothetical protein
MSSENPMKNSVEPRSIVMTYQRCDYCGQDDTQYSGISYNFGIKSCDIHYSLAKRDCNAYLHSNMLVRLSDTDGNPILKTFMEKMKTPFKVKRTSGMIQDGWTVRDNTSYDELYLRKLDGDWTFPCKHAEDNITKNVTIAEMTHVLDQSFIDSVLIVLEKGVYIQDFLAAGIQELHDEATFIEKRMVAGREVRIFSMTHGS